MKRLRPILFLALALLPSSILAADLRLATAFGNHMVLQRDKPVPVWGWAKPSDVVTVSFAGQTVEATAGDDGRWTANLAALKVSDQGQELTVAAKSGGDAVTIKDVLVGEVWLCSGQSNMEWSVKASNDSQKEIDGANHPNIRLLHVQRATASSPQVTLKGGWAICNPGSIPNFSAVGYFFGRELQRELGVPIGLVASSWGGTRIEPWTPVAGLESVELTKPMAAEFGDANAVFQKKLKAYVPVVETWVAQAKQAIAGDEDVPVLPPSPGPPNYGAGTPTALYNGMIHPLVPMAMRGAIWYQGESNNGEGMAYFEKMKALIGGWRTVFKNADLAFYFVQLAPFKYGNGEQTLPYIWEAQTAAALKIPNTGMAVTTDIGNVNDIHPRNKQDVGKRLALWALAKTYAKDDVDFSGPIFKSMAVEGKQIRLTFEHTAGGLKARDGKTLTDFVIAGEDGKFVPGFAKVDGETVLVMSPDVASPKHVRFGWHHMINPNLCNEAGLPASPFKTDKWLEGK